MIEKIKRIQSNKDKSKNLIRRIRRNRLGTIMENRIQLGDNVVEMTTWVDCGNILPVGFYHICSDQNQTGFKMLIKMLKLESKLTIKRENRASS